ncbi:hypothetical protein DL93DRAFT_105173 [Clavulina sp. PMI_390]|nr:hypothetical protein DL93DRAFT_105173 [Clavulina sp. PMI_390]
MGLSKVPDLPFPRNQNQNATSPILSLPTELLGEIFSLPTPVFAQPAEYREAQRIEWSISEYKKYRSVLASTCSRFRSITCHTPSCWTSVDIRLFSGRVNGVTSPDALQARLERSHPLPFDFAIGALPPLDTSLPHHHTPYEVLHAILKPHLPRCRSVSLLSRLHDIEVVTSLIGGVELPALDISPTTGGGLRNLSKKVSGPSSPPTWGSLLCFHSPYATVIQIATLQRHPCMAFLLSTLDHSRASVLMDGAVLNQ